MRFALPVVSNLVVLRENIITKNMIKHIVKTSFTSFNNIIQNIMKMSLMISFEISFKFFMIFHQQNNAFVDNKIMIAITNNDRIMLSSIMIGTVNNGSTVNE